MRIPPVTQRIGVLAAALLGTGLAAVAPAQAMSGGTAVTDPDTAPWVATLALRADGPLLQLAGCGGALIAPDRVLTAAHCIDHLDPSQLDVHVNARVLSGEPGEVRRIRAAAALPGYQILPSPSAPDDPNASSARNDLAVLLLDRPVLDIPPLPIARERPAPGSAVSVFAHGTTGKPAPDFRNDVLHRGDLTTITHGTCQASTPATVDEHSVTCAQDPAGLITGCFQDSGSPVVQYAHGRPELVGAFSFGGETAGKSCGQPAPEAFADATAFRHWALGPLRDREPYPVGSARVSGTPRVGQVLRCTAPTWHPAPDTVEYGWATLTHVGPFTIPAPIGRGAELTVTPQLVGKQVACTVVAANKGGTVQVLSEGLAVNE
ncbi:hypothetical protein BC739_008544 [Kutzneria viridogrisea]|uniref:Peptidase S1 domain-containing protein n=1 Tax=Kutzneria viridogrisea TaxID=47990 RepID=A0ABR6BXG3_9PSEU|nr:hypothetical protein [Kutzneria viridogrisea]